MNQRPNVSLLRDTQTQYVWRVLVLAWACFRAVAINKFFGDHSVNAWGYLAVDLASSIPYAIYSARAVISYLDKAWHDLRRNVIVSSLFFYIPDLYIFIFARRVSNSLYIGFIISIIIFSTLALISLKKDVTKV